MGTKTNDNPRKKLLVLNPPFQTILPPYTRACLVTCTSLLWLRLHHYLQMLSCSEPGAPPSCPQLARRKGIKAKGPLFPSREQKFSPEKVLPGKRLRFKGEGVHLALVVLSSGHLGLPHSLRCSLCSLSVLSPALVC